MIEKYMINNWALVVHPNDFEINKYLPPESQKYSISGDSVAHQKWVITSCIIKYNASTKSITTKNGSIYYLGKPSPAYVKWCQDNGHHIPTEEQPFDTKGPPCALP